MKLNTRIRDNLLEGESILETNRVAIFSQTPQIFITIILLLLIVMHYFYLSPIIGIELATILSGIAFLLAYFFVTLIVLNVRDSSIVVTDLRVISVFKYAVITLVCFKHEQIVHLKVEQNGIGRLFNYGTIVIGLNAATAKAYADNHDLTVEHVLENGVRITYVKNPADFLKRMKDRLNLSEQA